MIFLVLMMIHTSVSATICVNTNKTSLFIPDYQTIAQTIKRVLTWCFISSDGFTQLEAHVALFAP